MIDLKRTKEEIKKRQKQYKEIGYNDEIYPLCLYVSDAEVEKLGLEKAQVGDEMIMISRVKVTSVSKNERANDPSHYTVNLEFLEAELKKAPAEKSAADRLYESGNEDE